MICPLSIVVSSSSCFHHPSLVNGLDYATKGYSQQGGKNLVSEDIPKKASTNPSNHRESDVK